MKRVVSVGPWTFLLFPARLSEGRSVSRPDKATPRPGLPQGSAVLDCGSAVFQVWLA